MAGEQFSLCWDNFHSNMSSGLSSLYKTEDLVDVTLAAEGRYLKAHKMVLSVCSPYFRELFQVNPCKHPIVFLKDVSYNALSNLLEFMYQGEVKVSQDDLGTFIKTAEALKIKGLTGDGATQNDTETKSQTNVSSTEETTTTRKSAREREKSPPVRKKPMGPASKRIKVDNDSPPPLVSIPPSQQTQQQQPSQQPQISQPATEIVKQQSSTVEQQIMHFKMEPEETAVSLANEEDVTYDDSAMDDMGIDNSTDYLMESTTEMDNSKAGTSTAMDNVEATGDNQVSMNWTTPSMKYCSAEVFESTSSLLTPARSSQTSIILPFDMTKHVLVKIPRTGLKQKPQRRCKVCAIHKKRSETCYMCKFCEVPLHIENCFLEYHSELHYQ